MVDEKVKINVSRLGLTDDASKDEVFTALVKKWREYKIPAGIRPNGDKNCVIVSGIRDDVKKLLSQLKTDGLFIESEILGDRSTVNVPRLPWAENIGT